MSRFAAAFFLLLHSALFAQSRTAVLLISIDGMRPDYVTKADEHGLKIPYLRRILQEGAHATGVRGVLPTVTYPSHTTIVTGVWPAKHHIYSNVVFDPFDRNMAGWYWYSEDIAVPTLWEAASSAGLVTGSVSWPVTVGAHGIRYVIPEYWRAPKAGEEDRKLLRAISTPGLVAEIEKEAGPYVMDLDDARAGDRQRTRYAAAILRRKHAQFMTVHLAALDHIEHQSGPFSPEANATLEETDGDVGELEDAARAAFPGAVICVVSDHGFTRTDHSLNLRAAFVDAGLITIRDKKVEDWKAFPHVDGGSASILLKDPHDDATRAKVGDILRRLEADPANGIAGILDAKQIAALGGRSDAAFWVDMKPNFSVVGGEGPLLRERRPGGTHGFSPAHPELLASFFIAGPKIKRGLDLGEIDMRSIAPTLAVLLGVKFSTADLKPLNLF